MIVIHKYSKKIAAAIIGISLIVFLYEFAQHVNSLLAYIYIPRHETATMFASERLGIVIDQQMKIIQVEKNSTAERNGLKIGDKIISLYDKNVSTIKEASDHVRNVRSGRDDTVKVDIHSEFPLVIEREGKSIPMTIQFNRMDTPSMQSDAIEDQTTSNTPNNISVPREPTTTILNSQDYTPNNTDSSKQPAIITPTPVPVDMLYL